MSVEENASIFQNVRIGVEATKGTLVAATKLFQSIGIEPKYEAELDEFVPSGAKFGAVRPIGKEWSSAALSGRATYDELAYLFACNIGNLATTHPGTLAYQHVFTLNNRSRDTIKTLTVDRGSDRFWDRVGYSLVPELSIAYSRSAIEIGGSMLMQRMGQYNASSASSIQTVSVSGGPTSFTLTFSAQTTAAITTPATATAAAVQAALELLSTIGAGNVYVSGPNGGPWIVHFVNDLADATQTAITGTATPSGTVTVTQTQTGAALTTIPLVPILPKDLDIYLADAYADLDTADPLEHDFALDWSLSDRFADSWPLRSSHASFARHVETKPTCEWKLRLSNNDEGRALVATMRTGAIKYIRVKAVGEEIETGQNHTLIKDGCVQVSAAPDGPGDQDNVDTLEWTLGGAYSSTFNTTGGVLKATLKNSLVTL